ncbi:hypothetical protein PAPYR_9062 [Paratrimastix pyriformis]|uniref:Trimethylguanosine synthase n=1 Tax=Paratrimastix pyriformis TaxID=342808 RepID=A0ABQ8UBQ9_9EUKA|nr:hypothetical protein PAPYR_9062 [Paratrimastix pyriformis]
MEAGPLPAAASTACPAVSPASRCSTVFIRGIDQKCRGKGKINFFIRDAFKPFHVRKVRTLMHGTAFVHLATPEDTQKALAHFAGSPLTFHDHVLEMEPACEDKRDWVFPEVPYATRCKLALDPVALFSTTDQITADRMSILLRDLVLAGLPSGTVELPPHIAITDACACTGGNTLSFLKVFPVVRAVESAPERVALLVRNIGVYTGVEQPTQASSAPDHPHAHWDRLAPAPPLSGAHTVDVYGGDFVALLRGGDLRQQAVFIDPPWGGMTYSKAASAPGDDVLAELTLGAAPLASLALALGRRHADLVALKVPKNYDLDAFVAKMVNVVLPPRAPAPPKASRKQRAKQYFNRKKQKKGRVLFPYALTGLTYRNRTLDAVIRLINTWNATFLHEYHPKFFDWEKKRWIQLCKWKGCKLE